MSKLSNDAVILALDVGDRRIGVAKANLIARVAQPLTTLQNTEEILQEIIDLVKSHNVQAICVGLPRGLDGQRTVQTEKVKQFTAKPKAHLQTPVYLQDEAVTSRQAEAELKERGKAYTKSDIDALAATYILEDFLRDFEND